MKLYYFEIHGDKFIGEHLYNTPAIVLSFHNAKFFGAIKEAKIWRDRHCELYYNEMVLNSFECVDWSRLG